MRSATLHAARDCLPFPTPLIHPNTPAHAQHARAPIPVRERRLRSGSATWWCTACSSGAAWLWVGIGGPSWTCRAGMAFGPRRRFHVTRSNCWTPLNARGSSCGLCALDTEGTRRLACACLHHARFHYPTLTTHHPTQFHHSSGSEQPFFTVLPDWGDLRASDGSATNPHERCAPQNIDRLCTCPQTQTEGGSDST